jgi:deazaflavin-dependent oxidoreductase (nitroreductase family)
MTKKSSPSRAVRLLFRLPSILYSCRCGWLLGRRLLLLINVGRRTGKIYRTVLEVVEYRPALLEAIVLSAFGTRADWLLNVQTQTRIEIVIASRELIATCCFPDEEEAAAALLGYQHRNRSIAPLIRFALGRFVGWRYDGSPAHARRLVRQLPVVGFRPAAVVPLSCGPSGSIVRHAAGLHRPLKTGPFVQKRLRYSLSIK